MCIQSNQHMVITSGIYNYLCIKLIISNRSDVEQFDKECVFEG